VLGLDNPVEHGCRTVGSITKDKTVGFTKGILAKRQ
jgi:hypothetical protein